MMGNINYENDPRTINTHTRLLGLHIQSTTTEGKQKAKKWKA